MSKLTNGYVTNDSGTYTKPVRIRKVKPLDGFKAHFTFTDGTEREIDLDKYIRGPVFEPIRNDPKLFRAMYVDGGTIAWPGEVDIDPDTLYYGDSPIPWMVEYEEREKKRKARQLRERRAKLRIKARGKAKVPTAKQRTAKPSARKKVVAKKK
jgi:hypothetical protein